MVIPNCPPKWGKFFLCLLVPPHCSGHVLPLLPLRGDLELRGGDLLAEHGGCFLRLRSSLGPNEFLGGNGYHQSLVCYSISGGKDRLVNLRGLQSGLSHPFTLLCASFLLALHDYWSGGAAHSFLT